MKPSRPPSFNTRASIRIVSPCSTGGERIGVQSKADAQSSCKEHSVRHTPRRGRTGNRREQALATGGKRSAPKLRTSAAVDVKDVDSSTDTPGFKGETDSKARVPATSTIVDVHPPCKDPCRLTCFLPTTISHSTNPLLTLVTCSTQAHQTTEYDEERQRRHLRTTAGLTVALQLGSATANWHTNKLRLGGLHSPSCPPARCQSQMLH